MPRSFARALRITVIVASVAVMTTSTASAQWTLDGYAGGGTTAVAGVRIERALQPRVGVDVGVEYVHGLVTPPRERSLLTVSTVRLYLRSRGALVPYVAGGAGTLTTVDAGDPTFVAVIGGGVQWMWRPALGLRVDVRALRARDVTEFARLGDPDTRRIDVATGLVFRF